MALPPTWSYLLGFTIFSLFHSVSRRASIAKIVTAESGRYCKDLSEKVTHLVVCSSPEDDSAPDSAKVQWAKAVNANRRRDGLTPEGLIKIVWEEWLWDCHEWQGMGSETTSAMSESLETR